MVATPLQKQVTNRDLTGSLAEIGMKASRHWDTAQIPEKVFIAVCELTLMEPGQGVDGFTPQEVYEQVGRSHKGWSHAHGRDLEEISRLVRKNWKILTEKRWLEREEGVREIALQEGIPNYPAPQKIPGGGAGNTTRYRLQAQGLEADKKRSLTQCPEADIQYVCSLAKKTPWLARVIFGSNLLEGMRRWALAVVMFAGLMAALLVILIFLWGLVATKNFGDLLRLGISSGIILWGIWLTVGPLYRCVQDRITVAPWWLQNEYTSILIELRGKPLYRDKALLAVEYTAICPICESVVRAASGKKQDNKHLVGRCDSAPRSHVFTFDHISMRGDMIRS